jgi:NAD(P)-dependent dehydrogenase (short-subunit alcohol dehydrogenase family)
MTLRGRGIIITGGSQGFGKAVGEACVDAGADVLLCARGEAELDAACQALRQRAAAGQQVMCQPADVSDPEAVSRLVEDAGRRLPRFTGLVNNAGIYGPKGRLEDVPWEEWARAVEINLFGTALPCRAAIPVFRRRGYGKIVNLSGGGATAPLPRLSSYAASKAAVVRLTETLAHETAGAGIDVNAVAPGSLNTRLLDEVLFAGPEQVGEDFYRKALRQKETGGAPLEKGAALCAYLLSAESDGISGRLIAAIWDPWTTLAARARQLAESDVYTLRRIVPRDRGFDWDKE